MAVKNIEDLYRLSPVQEGMLFHALAAPGSGVYFEQFTLGYGSGFAPEAFARAWQRVVDRHPVLRTSFLWEELEAPVQVVHRQVELPVDRQDWRGLSPGEQQERLRAYLAADRRSGFDVTRPPLLRLGLIRTGEQEHRVVWGYHHLLLDGWSAGLVMREVSALYREETGGEAARLEPHRPYKDYVDWLLGQDLAEAEAYWRRTLAGFTAPTPLGVDAAPSGSEVEPGYDLRLRPVSAPATAALKAFARGARLTLNTLVQGAWALLLARASGEQDVVFGTTVSGRPPTLPGVESMIGCFINTLPVRVRVAAGQELVPWLQELQSALAEMRRYEHSPLARVLGWSAVPRPLPLFESIVVFESFTPESAFEISHSGVFQRTNYPLTLAVSPEEELTLRLGYETGRFSADAIERLLRHLEVLLAGMAGGGPQRLEELPLLTAPERHQVLVEWNDTRVGEFLAPGLTLHGLVEAQAARTPEAVAVVFEEKRLTYRELDARANRLASHLRRLGVGPEAPVGVCLERSVELVVALLGILKAGGSYLPLDPSYPAERLAWMLADACRGGEPPVLLVQERLLTVVPEAARAGVRVVLLETGWGAAMDGGEAAPEGGAGPDHAAYVIYTSGSTGKPKGAMNTHRAIVNRLLWMQETYRLTADDRVLQKTPFSFDVSVWEFFWPLLAGARLVVARPGGHQDPAYLARLIVEQGVTTVHFVPPMLHAFLDEPEAAKCTCLRRVIASGEALPADLVRRFHSRFAPAGVGLHNLYGPTEAAVDVTFWPCERPGPGPTAPIGRPVANTEIRLLDAGLQPVPIGVPGELHIGGVQLARGYLGRPELTAEKFIPDPFRGEPGARLYKTGDLARYGADGAIEFLGRIDHQVKIRGFRIELGEIEAALRAHSAVREAAVVAREGAAGGRRLVAYYVAHQGQVARPDELRAFLQAQLPEPSVPSLFVELAALPLTPSGKVDRRALPAPGTARPDLEESFVAPRTPAERALAEIWARVLGVERVGAHDSFFTLGGDSILSLRVVAQAREAGIHLLPRQLFQHPTIARLAAAVAGGVAREEPRPPAVLVPAATSSALAMGVDREALGRLAGSGAEVEDVYPLSPGQQDMLAHSLTAQAPQVYFQQVCFTLRGALDVAAFAAAWQRAIDRHPALRTTFAWTGLDEPLQLVRRRLAVPIEQLDWRGTPPAEQPERLHAWLEADVEAGFDLTRPPLLRLALIRTGEGEHRFIWSFHHLLLDGWSISRLLTEVLDLYGALRQGREPALPASRPFRDHIAWLRQQDLGTAEAFWRRELAGFTAPTPLPTRPPGASAPAERPSYGELRERLEVQATADLQALARRHELTLNTLVQGAWALLLSRAAGASEVLFGATSSGRAAALPGIESTIGLLMNTLPLRVEVAPDAPLLPWLQQLQERQSRVLEHEHTPPAQLREWCEVPEDLPLFESTLRFENYPVSASAQDLQGDLTIGDLIWSDYWHYPLSLVVVPGSELLLQIAYSRSRSTVPEAARLLKQVRGMLASFGRHPDRHLAALDFPEPVRDPAPDKTAVGAGT